VLSALTTHPVYLPESQRLRPPIACHCCYVIECLYPRVR